MGPKFDSMICAFNELAFVATMISHNDETTRLQGFSYLIGMAVTYAQMSHEIQLHIPERHL